MYSFIVYDGNDSGLLYRNDEATKDYIESKWPFVKNHPSALMIGNGKIIGVDTVEAYKQRYYGEGLDGLSNVEALAMVAEKLNTPVEISPDPTERLAAATEAQNLAAGMAVSENVTSANLKRGLWTASTLAAGVTSEAVDGADAVLMVATASNDLADKGKAVLDVKPLKAVAETVEFSDAQILIAGKAGFWDAWQPDMTYITGKRLEHNGGIYVVIQDVTSIASQPHVTSIASQPPDAEGMLAVYRPVVPDHAGTPEDPIPFVLGMDVYNDKYYIYNGVIYLAKADMIPCVWPPDTPGLWQWEAQ